MRSDDNCCLLLHNQHVIRFNCVQTNNILTSIADLFYFNTQDEKFTQNRREKCEIQDHRFVGGLKCYIIKNYETGFRLPILAMILSSKKNNYLYTLALNYTEKKGSQLQIYHRFPLDDVKSSAILLDGPTFVFYTSNRLKSIYYNSKEYKTNQKIPENVPKLIFSNENDSCLYFIDAKKGFLTSFCFESDELVTKNAFISEDFMCEYCGKLNHVFVDWNVRNLSQSVAFVCTDRELFEFKNGRLIKSTFLRLNDKDGTLLALNDQNFEVMKRWENVEGIGIDDVFGTGNKFVFIQFKSVFNDFVGKLNDNSLITNITDFYHPNGEMDECDVKCDQMSSAVKAIENKLHIGEFMLEDVESRIKEKDSYINETVTRIQELSTNGVINSTPVYPHVVDLMSTGNGIDEEIEKNSKPPLKIDEMSGRIHKEFWLIRLKVENQSNKILGDFSVQITSSGKEIQFTVKFFRDDLKEKDIGLRNVMCFENYFSTDSPTVKQKEKIDLVAAIKLSQPIFENLCVDVQVCVIFSEISEENERINALRQQICGSLTYNFDFGEPLGDKRSFDVWDLATTERTVTLNVNATESNLENIKKLICDNLRFAYDVIYEILYAESYNHPLANVGIQIPYEISQSETQIRVYFNTETELILFLHLIYSHLPSDIIVTPVTGNLKALTNVLKTSLQEELNIIRELITSQSKSQFPNIEIDLNSQSPLESLKKIRNSFTTRQKWLQESRNGQIPQKIYEKLHEKLKQMEETTDSHVGLLNDITFPFCNKIK